MKKLVNEKNYTWFIIFDLHCHQKLLAHTSVCNSTVNPRLSAHLTGGTGTIFFVKNFLD